MNRGFDLVAFVFGMIMVAFAGVALWMVLVGPIPVSWLKIAAPLFLVLVGVVGLTLSRAQHADGTEPSPYGESSPSKTMSQPRKVER